MKKIILALSLLIGSQAFAGVTLMVCSYEGGSQSTWVADEDMLSYTNQCRDDLGGTSAPSLSLEAQISG